jgi:uncharacterized protein YkwD
MCRLFLLLVLLGLSGAAVAVPATSVTILQGINAFRHQQGLPPLEANALIAKIAAGHSANMADHSVPFSHDGFRQRMHKLFTQFPQTHGAAENVAFSDWDDAGKIVTQWLGSAPHRKNILGNFNLTGIGIARGDHHRVFVTEIFLKDGAITE